MILAHGQVGSVADVLELKDPSEPPGFASIAAWLAREDGPSAGRPADDQTVAVRAGTVGVGLNGIAVDALEGRGGHLPYAVPRQVPDVMPVFVEPLLPPTGDANPSEDMTMIELQRFPEVGQRLTAALRDAAGAAVR